MMRSEYSTAIKSYRQHSRNIIYIRKTWCYEITNLYSWYIKNIEDSSMVDHQDTDESSFKNYHTKNLFQIDHPIML